MHRRDASDDKAPHPSSATKPKWVDFTTTELYFFLKLYIYCDKGLMMRTISATEAKQGLAALLETAAREPVMIQRQKRDVAVVLSPQEYARLARLNVEEFQQFCDRIGTQAQAAGLTETKLDQLLASDD
jgi:antitoxin Phd